MQMADAATFENIFYTKSKTEILTEIRAPKIQSNPVHSHFIQTQEFSFISCIRWVMFHVLINANKKNRKCRRFEINTTKYSTVEWWNRHAAQRPINKNYYYLCNRAPSRWIFYFRQLKYVTTVHLHRLLAVFACIRRVSSSRWKFGTYKHFFANSFFSEAIVNGEIVAQHFAENKNYTDLS